MKILVTGPQGSGKTTQAKLLAKFLRLSVITVGDAMRQLAKTNTPDGRQVKQLLDLGQMAPDKVVADYVRPTIAKKDFQEGFVMDGYPRNINQLKLFDPHFDRVFYLDVSDKLAIQRLLQRGREDDIISLITERLRLYHKRTKPLLRLYKSQGILSRVDGTGLVKDIQERIREGLRIELMRKSGEITAKALKKVLQSIKVGVSGLELDQIAETEIKKYKGELSFKSVKNYNFASCITINDQVVHGLPSGQKIKEGDLVSIDLGTVYKGWHTDAAWTVEVNNKKNKFLEIGEEALWQGIAKAVEGNKIGDISAAIQQKVEGAGYSVVRSLVGHGVGRALHEEPEVPGFGEAGTGPILKAGTTLAIEVIYIMGKKDVVLDQDGWTIKSADGSPAGLFEMSIIVGPKGGKPEVLTDWRKIP